MALASQVKLWLRGLFGVYRSSTVDVEDDVNRLFRKTLCVTVPANGTADANIDATYFYKAEENCKIISAYIMPPAITTDATNYLTFNLQLGDGAGGSPATIATHLTNTANVAADVPVALTVSAADIDSGEVLAFNVTRAGGTDAPDIAQHAWMIELEEI